VHGPDEPLDHDPAGIAIGLRRALLAAIAGALVATASGHAAVSMAVLPSPFFPIRSEPPLHAAPVAAETRFPGRLSSTQAVRVSIDSTGQPFRIVDVDRIVVAHKGDYSFVVGAPVEDVRSAAGSGSEPGLRSGAVVWQGFSPGRRVLVAGITLRARAAESVLPLRIEVKGSELRFMNTTSASAAAVDAAASALDVARALDDSRAALKANAPAPAPVVNAQGPVRDAHVVAQVPLQVRGTVRFAGRQPRKLAIVVGRNPVRISGAGELKALELSVVVPEPADVLRPPGARRWLDLARSGRLADGRSTTRLAVDRLLAAALAVQYRQFLVNPDARGVTKSSYRYELAPQLQTPAAEQSSGGHGWLVSLAVALGLAVVATVALVLWAHS